MPEMNQHLSHFEQAKSLGAARIVDMLFACKQKAIELAEYKIKLKYDSHLFQNENHKKNVLHSLKCDPLIDIFLEDVNNNSLYFYIYWQMDGTSFSLNEILNFEETKKTIKEKHDDRLAQEAQIVLEKEKQKEEHKRKREEILAKLTPEERKIILEDV